MKYILERRSIRKYKTRIIPHHLVEKFLRAAMAAPSAENQQSWEFILISNKKILNDITYVHSAAKMLKVAPIAIVVCSDIKKTKNEYWPQDCSAATENILIEAQYLGLGAVWLGVYPREDRVRGLKELLNLPEKIIPFSIISIGYPAEKKEPSNRYDQSRIHINKW